MDDLLELPPHIQEYIQDHGLPIEIYSSDFDTSEMFEGDLVVVTAVIRNNADEVLFIRHSEENRFWELPSGHAKEHEMPNDAIRREVLEETGYTLQELSPTNAIIWAVKPTKIQIVFTAKIDSKTSEDTNEEAEEIKFYTSIPDNVTFGKLGREAYEYYLNNLDSFDNGTKKQSYIKQGVAAFGILFSVAALKGIQKYRSEETDTESDTKDTDA